MGRLSDFQTDAAGECREVRECSAAVGAQEVDDHAVDRGPVADIGGRGPFSGDEGLSPTSSRRRTAAPGDRPCPKPLRHQ
jgi:hypothetical protein